MDKHLPLFIEKFLCPELWKGAVVVMDNLPAHRFTSIVPMIEAVGASVELCCHILQIFTPLNFGGHNSNLFKTFVPTTTSMVDKYIAVALELMNPEHLRNWFANCCYCTS